MTDLQEQLQAAAAELSPELGLLLMGVVHELERLDKEVAALADELVGDRRHWIQGEPNDEHADAGPDGGVPRSPRPHSITDRYARL